MKMRKIETSNADFQSAVTQISNLQSVRILRGFGRLRTCDTADDKSALQSGSKLRALHTLRAVLDARISRQRMECAQLAAALETRLHPKTVQRLGNDTGC